MVCDVRDHARRRTPFDLTDILIETTGWVHTDLGLAACLWMFATPAADWVDRAVLIALSFSQSGHRTEGMLKSSSAALTHTIILTSTVSFER